MYDNKKNTESGGAITLYVKKGNEVMDEIVSESGAFTMNRSYPIGKGEELSVCVKGVDGYGYTHEMFVTGWSTGEASADVAYEVLGPCIDQIYAPDGTPMIE